MRLPRFGTTALLVLALSWRPAAWAQDDFRQRPAEPPPAEPAPAPVLTKPPRVKKTVDPLYPPEALAAGVSADVVLQIDIDAEGRVSAVSVTKPAGQGFDEAARDAALQMEFEPAEIDGKPAPIRIEYVQRFRPAVPAPPPPPLEPQAEPPPAPPPEVKQLVVQGQLRERGTRDPIAGADVTLDRGATAPAVVASTDAEGRFSVEAPPGGQARLVVSSADHEPCIRDVELPGPGGPPLQVTCLVLRRIGDVYETVVVSPGEGEDATRHVVQQKELTTVPGTFGDPLRVIQNLPGIARTPFGLGLLIIRGSSPQDSGVYVDGHRVPLLYHFLGGPSVLTPALIGRIDFYPGGFGVRYGRATAGVVDVGTRTDPIKRVHGEADVDFLDSSAYVEGPLGGGFSGGVAARRSYVDALLPFVLPEQQGSTTVVVTPVYWDYQGRVTRTLDRGRLSLFSFGSSDSLEVYSQDPERGDLEIGTRIMFHRVIATWDAALGDWTSSLSPSYGYDRVTFGSGTEVGGKASAHVFGLREELSRALLPSLKLVMGLDGELRFDRFDFDVPLPTERRTYGQTERPITGISRSLTNSGAAAYVEALWDLHPTLRLVPGLRFDWFHYSAADLTSLDPRLVVRWSRTPTQVFKVGAGVFHQPPDPAQLDPEFGNPDLDLMWSDQYHVGIEQGLTRALAFDATLYYLRRHDIPLASTREVAPGRTERYASAGRGRSYGLELRLRHAVTERFFGWISYTLARSEETVSVPSEGEAAPPWQPTIFDQTHNLILVASRRFGAWELGTRFRVVTGIPETPVLDGTYDADYDNWDPIEGAPGSQRRQTFHQLDLRAERTFTFDAWQFSAYLDVQNVYNAENPEATIYDYRFRERAPVRGLPFLPVLGLRGRF